VHEPVAAGRLVEGFDQSDGEGGVDGVHAVGLVGPARADERGEIERLAQDGGEIDRVADRRTEPAQPGADGVADRGGDVLAAAERDDAAAAFQVGPQLTQEERVSPGTVAQDGGGSPGPGQRDAAAFAHELRDRVGVEAAEVQAVDAVEAVQVGQPLAELRRSVGGRVPEGDHEQRPGVDADVGDVSEKGDRGHRRPVQVVEDDGEWAILREPTEQEGEGVEQVAADVACRVVTCRPVACGLGREPAEVEGGAREQLGHRARLAVDEQVIEDLHERLVGHTAVLGRRPDEDGDAMVAQRPRHLGGQPGLARAGLAPYQDDLAVSGLDPRPDLLQGLQLVAASHQTRLASRGEAPRQRNRAPRPHARTVPPPPCVARWSDLTIRPFPSIGPFRS
jgi:hypothetical protein